MDQPPQSSRSSLNEPHQVTQGPIPVFDIHLRYLTESYLSFFQERCVLVSALYLHCEYVFMLYPFVSQEKARRSTVRTYVLCTKSSHVNYPSIESMRKLYRKTKLIDIGLDDKGDLTTLRHAWSEVVENLDRGEY